MMPFGGHDRTLQRSCMLNFLRLKYIVEKEVKSIIDQKGENQEIGYEVTGFYATVGGISDPAVRMIRNADILIGLITETNVNVIYELAVRSLLVDVPILIVKGDPDEMLPLYLKGLSSIDYIKHTPKQILDQIEQLAQSEFPDPLSLETPIPDSLKGTTDKYDKSLQEELGRALSQMEGPPMEGPRGPLFKDLLDEVARNYNPPGILQIWQTYYPTSIVKMYWKQRSRKANGYTTDDMDGQPVVCAHNDDFLKLYDFGGDVTKDSLTMEVLINQLKDSQIVDEADLAEFLVDQSKLTEKIILRNAFSHAKVPLRINGNHPNDEYINKAYLPCLIGKRIVGDPSKPHCMYLLVCYVEVQQFDRESEGSNGKEKTPVTIQNGE